MSLWLFYKRQDFGIQTLVGINLRMRARMKKNQSGNFALALFLALILYPGGDSNSHALRHTHLKRTCIPFQHLGMLYFSTTVETNI